MNCERQSIFKLRKKERVLNMFLNTYKESTVVSKDYTIPFIEESGLKHKKFFRRSRKLEYVLYPEPLPRVPYSVCVTSRAEKTYIA